MRKPTHVLGGVTAGLITQKFLSGQFTLAEGAEPILFVSSLLAGSFIGSVLPDIDHPNSFIGRKLKISSFIINKLFGHRGITHTLIFSIVIPLIIAVIAFYGLDGLAQSMMMYFSIGLFVGILSHLILDAMTKSGVPLLYPFTDKTFRIGGLIKTGGKTELLVRFSLFIFVCYLTADLINLNDLVR